MSDVHAHPRVATLQQPGSKTLNLPSLAASGPPLSTDCQLGAYLSRHLDVENNDKCERTQIPVSAASRKYVVLGLCDTRLPRGYPFLHTHTAGQASWALSSVYLGFYPEVTQGSHSMSKEKMKAGKYQCLPLQAPIGRTIWSSEAPEQKRDLVEKGASGPSLTSVFHDMCLQDQEGHLGAGS